MKTRLTTLILAAMLYCGTSVVAGEIRQVVYKKVDAKELSLNIHYPSKDKLSPKSPAIVFYFGGGWSGGSIDQFEPHAEHLARRRMVAVLVEYRTAKSAGVTPFECVGDARSAMRYVRSHAAELGIDPDRIAASGGSAGGHLAAATAYVTSFDDPSDDPKVSARPNALVLFNPVIDNSEKGYGYERVKQRYKEFSPMHNIKGNAVPTIFMVGDEDHLIPVETAREYKRITDANGANCILKIYEGSPHGFFNFKNTEMYKKTLWEMDRFLVKIGYLKPLSIK